MFGISINIFMPYLILYYEKTLGMTNYVMIMAPAIVLKDSVPSEFTILSASRNTKAPMAGPRIPGIKPGGAGSCHAESVGAQDSKGGQGESGSIRTGQRNRPGHGPFSLSARYSVTSNQKGR